MSSTDKGFREDPKDQNPVNVLITKPCLTNPHGLLAIHLKKLRILNMDWESLFPNSDLSVYLKLHVGNQMKMSYVQRSITGPTSLLMDIIQHFSLTIVPRRNDESNRIKIELIAFDSSCHRPICKKELCLFDIIKNLYVCETYDLRRFEKLIADVELEFCFTYGMFGFGYSNQLENRHTSAKEQINHSMFCRPGAPQLRTNSTLPPDVLSSRHVGHPSFINFTQKVEIGKTANDFANEYKFHSSDVIEEPVNVIMRMRKKMHALHSEYAQLTSRKKRINFLKNTIRHDDLKRNDTEKFNVPATVRLRNKEMRSSVIASRHFEDLIDANNADFRTPVINEEDENNHYDDDIGVEDNANILHIAPGIISSRRRDHSKKQKAKASAAQSRWGAAGFIARMFAIGASQKSAKEAESNSKEVDQTPTADETAIQTHIDNGASTSGTQSNPANSAVLLKLMKKQGLLASSKKATETQVILESESDGEQTEKNKNSNISRSDEEVVFTSQPTDKTDNISNKNVSDKERELKKVDFTVPLSEENKKFGHVDTLDRSPVINQRHTIQRRETLPYNSPTGLTEPTIDSRRYSTGTRKLSIFAAAAASIFGTEREAESVKRVILTPETPPDSESESD